MLSEALQLNRSLTSSATTPTNDRLVIAHGLHTIQVLLIDTCRHLWVVSRDFRVHKASLPANLIVAFLERSNHSLHPRDLFKLGICVRLVLNLILFFLEDHLLVIHLKLCYIIE